MKAFARVLAAGLVLGMGGAAQVATAQAESDYGDLAPMTFTAPQATGGGANYRRLCASCHGHELEGTAGPALSGEAFSYRIGEPVFDLHDFIKNVMPPSAPGTLTDAQVATIIAYIAQGNGMKAGGPALPTNPEELESIAFGQ